MEEKRKLATIQQILNIQKIPDADKIEVVSILGWKVVVRKDENYKIGQEVIYCEIDSVLPDKPEFEFLRKSKFRIKTIKLRGQVSQGLILPMTTLPDKSIPFGELPYIGRDVTELIGITKYVSLSEKEKTNIINNKYHWTKQYKLTNYFWRFKWFREVIHPTIDLSWPSHISKTDEERIQNIPEILEEYKDYTLSVTEKIDYQSVTFTSINNKLVVCSRNLKNNNKTSLYWRIAEKYNLESICKKYPNIVIQGEQGGPGVQSNKYKLKEPNLFVFNVIKNGYFLSPSEMKLFCNDYGLQTVPYLGSIKLSQFKSLEELITFAEGKSIINPQIQREGLVLRYIRNGKKILSFKIINNKFLLKYE